MNSEKALNNYEANETLKPRNATRTVVFDKDGKVAIINVEKHGYYKIPGGGIEEGEDLDDAALREAKEETGCDCVIIDKIGQIETEIPAWEMLDISDGFIAVVSGEKNSPEYEDWEKERGFKVEWFDDINSAIKTISQNVATEPEASTLQKRDLTFLKLAKEKLDQ